MKRTVIFVAVTLLLATGAASGSDYIGAPKCKMCHIVQYKSWLQNRHAKAFEVLKPEEQGNAECLECHATAGNAEMPGVQCESCHGPGSDYKDMKVMKDREASIAAGLIIPDEALCRSCHDKAPHDVPAFDYAERVKTGVHEHKQAK